MPRREQCDGKDPCERCSRSGRQCLFSSNQHESKDALRAEIERLRRNNERSNALLDAVSSPNNLGMLNMMAQRLHDNRTDSRHAILLDFAARIRTGCLDGRPVSSDLPISVSCPYLDEEGVVFSPTGEACDGKSPSLTSLLSISSPTPSPKPLLLRTEPTQTCWDVAHVRQLVESLARWDHMPLCLLNQKLFLEDLACGRTQYCSPALINALVTLAMRMKRGSADEALSERTLSLLRESSGQLPDIQALGVFALYQLMCGREAEARDLAASFVTAMSRLRETKPCFDEDGSDDRRKYDQVVSSSYCGAISLVREDGNPSIAYGDDDLQTMSARMFQLFEWVYKMLAFGSLNGHEGNSWSRVLAAYKKCLDWYGSFFAMPRTSAGNSPFVLFVHIFYQFCLLRLFQPFVSDKGGETDSCAREICLQAAQSILRLSESYAGIYGLSHVSPLLAHFVFASGKFSLAAEKAGHGLMNIVSMRVEASSSKAGFETGIVVDETFSPSSSLPHVLMSLVAHARLLLDEMSETHPMAAMAEAMLRTKLFQPST
ncbi:hypothetical protein CP532_6953 [Ophiocordyceps camponoti-leonardi (nom. inval.)]|nr:hypothetical protein CP532_6953 [Ophiocordyceps camponoti-leonardi (nom. inval.)]